MKKVFMFIILSLLVISMLGAVSARTLIAGKIYNADYTATISDASVTVNCDGNILPATSQSDGAYAVIYTESVCENGDPLTVSATKGSLYGSNSGIIHDNVFEDWNLAIVNVPLVPEFGLIVGLTTILGALGVFFIVRRK